MAKQSTNSTFECPRCGGARVYQAALGGLVCEYCGYQETIDAPVAGRTAGESEFTEEALAQAEHGWQVDHQQMQCQQCGGETLLPPGVLTRTCPYCGSHYVVGHKATDDLLRPHFMLPFRTAPERCRAITQEWLGSSWMTPRQLREQANLDSYTPLYVPFWIFDAQASADWRAEVGYDKTTVDSEGELETETEWKWESGQVRLRFDDLYVSGTTSLHETLVRRITDFDLGKLVAYNPAYLAGHHAQAYQVTLNQAWETARTRMREGARAKCEREARSGGGDQVCNLSLRNFELHDGKWRYVLLPVYVSAYSYREQVYQILINGQQGTIGGQRPVSWPKVYLAAFAPLLPFVLAFLALPFAGDLWRTLSGLPTIVGLGLAAGVIALLGVALRWSRKTIRQAHYIEAAGADEEGGSGPQRVSQPKTWALALAPPLAGLLLLLAGSLGLVGGSSLGRGMHAPAAFRTLSKLAATLHLSSIPSQIAMVMLAAGFYAFTWGLKWARKTLQKAPGGKEEQ